MRVNQDSKQCFIKYRLPPVLNNAVEPSRKNNQRCPELLHGDN